MPENKLDLFKGPTEVVSDVRETVVAPLASMLGDATALARRVTGG